MMTEQNPIGLDGVEFIEYSGANAAHFKDLFTRLAFKEMASVKGKSISLFRQGDINFILNTEPHTFAAEFTKLHGPSVCSTGFRVQDAELAFKEAVKRGGKPYTGTAAQKGATPFPAIYGIGDSLVYFMDAKNTQTLYKDIFNIDPLLTYKGVGLRLVDHFTNNVPVGEMQKWCDFYKNVFNFREARYFDIKGKSTGLFSKVMRSPCGKFSVPINEPQDKKSQIQEYLEEYKGSGIQHIAMLTDDIVLTLESMKQSNIEFLTPPPDSYYKMLNDRVPNVTEDLKRLQKNAILVDGDEQGYLLQIFSKNVIGPVFYELIQRKNHFGFGDGNFQALFDAMERDQQERGYL